MKNRAFYFMLKAFFVLNISKFLYWLDYKDKVNFKIYDINNLVNKHLQYTYRPISQEVKTIRQ